MHQRYKLQWEEHKDRGEEHRSTLTVQQKVLLMNWCLKLIPEYNVVVSMVKMVALHTYFLDLVYLRVASTKLEENINSYMTFWFPGPQNYSQRFLCIFFNRVEPMFEESVSSFGYAVRCTSIS